MKPSVKHGDWASRPAEARALFERFSGGVIIFTDGIQLLKDLFKSSLLMLLEGRRVLGAVCDEFRELAVASSGEFVLLFLPLFIGIFEQRANMIIEVIAHHRGLVAVGTKNDIADHEVFDVFNVNLVALEAAHGNVPRIDFGQLQIIDVCLGESAYRSACRCGTCSYGPAGGPCCGGGIVDGRGAARFPLTFAKT